MKPKTKKLMLFLLFILQEIIIIAAAFLFYDYRAAKERLAELEQEPYFTEDKLSEEEFELILDCLKMTSWPSWEGRWSVSKWPDYSYYGYGLASPEAQRQFTVLNYLLFIQEDGTNQQAIQKATEYGLSLKEPVEQGFVMGNGKYTVEILQAMDDGGDCLRDEAFVNEIIQKFYSECNIVSVPRELLEYTKIDVSQMEIAESEEVKEQNE